MFSNNNANSTNISPIDPKSDPIVVQIVIQEPPLEPSTSTHDLKAPEHVKENKQHAPSVGLKTQDINKRLAEINQTNISKEIKPIQENIVIEKPLENLIPKIAATLRKDMVWPHDCPSPEEVTERVLDHMILESALFLSLIHTSKSNDYSQVIIHGKFEQFKAFKRICELAEDYGFLTDNAFCLSGNTVPEKHVTLRNKKSEKHDATLKNKKDDMKEKEGRARPVNIIGGTVNIIVCCGYEDVIEGDDLKEVLKNFAAAKPKRINIILGQYNHPFASPEEVERIYPIEQEKWIEKNSHIYKEYGDLVKEVKIAELYKLDEYQQNAKVVFDTLFNLDQIAKDLAQKDTINFVSRQVSAHNKTKKKSPKKPKNTTEEINNHIPDAENVPDNKSKRRPRIRTASRALGETFNNVSVEEKLPTKTVERFFEIMKPVFGIYQDPAEAGKCYISAAVAMGLITFKHSEESTLTETQVHEHLKTHFDEQVKNNAQQNTSQEFKNEDGSIHALVRMSSNSSAVPSSRAGTPSSTLQTLAIGMGMAITNNNGNCNTPKNQTNPSSYYGPTSPTAFAKTAQKDNYKNSNSDDLLIKPAITTKCSFP